MPRKHSRLRYSSPMTLAMVLSWMPPFLAETAGAEAPAPITVIVSADKKEFSVLEPVELTVTYKNVTDKEIRFGYLAFNPYDDIELGVYIMVRGVRQAVPRTCYYQTLHGATPGKSNIKLKPGQEMRWKMSANLVSDMTLPADYVVVASVEYIGYDAGAAKFMQKNAESAPIQIRVKHPRLTHLPPK